MSIHIVDDNSTLAVKASDRCFNYGDGCFTTMLVYCGVVQMLSAHMSRFHQTCARLGITNLPFAEIRKTVRDFCNQEYLRSDEQLFVVKVLISRGSGGRGYQIPDNQSDQAQVYLSKSQYPQHYDKWQSNGIRLGVSSVKLGINPLLAGMKHCNRLEQVMIKQQMPQGVDDVVVLDVNDKVVECSASNIFWYKNGVWYTPTLAGSGVAGIMRQCILAHMADNGIAFEYLDVGLSELFDIEACIVCNSLTGPVFVNEINFGTEQIRRQGQTDNVVKLKGELALSLCQSVRDELTSIANGN